MAYNYIAEKNAQKYKNDVKHIALFCIKKGREEAEQIKKILTCLTNPSVNKALRSYEKENKHVQKEHGEMMNRLNSINDRGAEKHRLINNLVRDYKNFYRAEGEFTRIDVSNPEFIILSQKLIDSVIEFARSKKVKVEHQSALDNDLITIGMSGDKMDYSKFESLVEKDFIQALQKINPYLSIDVITMSIESSCKLENGVLSLNQTVLNCSYKQINAAEVKSEMKKKLEKEVDSVSLESIKILESLLKHKVEKSHIMDSFGISEKAFDFIVNNLKAVKEEKMQKNMTPKKRAVAKSTV